MCFDRIKEGMLPACVKSCPTGAMSFGDRKVMIEKATKRLEDLKNRYPEAMLADSNDVRVIYLLTDDPKKYHKHAVAENTAGMTRKLALHYLLRPIINLRRFVG
jgi:formate dehydrogenase iron-sulfur subunit